jgi:Fe-S cluster assembly protein SufD
MLLDEGAHLAYHAVQQLGEADWQLAYQLSRVARDGVLRSFSAALGGSYARLFTRSDLVGEGAESRLGSTYLAKGNQVQDLRTYQEHSVARTTSNLVFKGAVRDHARSVYSGMIHMAKGSRRSVAAQTNRNLVLSEGAHADSVPNLDIEENDVRCSHASAVGPIDADQRFYLESRGVPTEVANRLILLGFFDDLFDEVPSPGCAAYLREVFAQEIESEPV